jgi:NADH dehydrogenase
MGVEVRLGTLAVGMDGRSVTVQGPQGPETIRTRTRIWAAGVQASPLARILAAQAGVEPDRAGRIPVEPDCTLPGYPEVFAIGDMVSLNGLPGVAQPAIQEGKYVAGVIEARLGGAPPPGPFRYFDKGSMATIGYRSAVADAFGVRVTGPPAYVMWALIHVAYLVGWGNRLGTLYTWARALWFSHNRAHRIITFGQEGTMAALARTGRPMPLEPAPPSERPTTAGSTAGPTAGGPPTEAPPAPADRVV